MKRETQKLGGKLQLIFLKNSYVIHDMLQCFRGAQRLFSEKYMFGEANIVD